LVFGVLGPRYLDDPVDIVAGAFVFFGVGAVLGGPPQSGEHFVDFEFEFVGQGNTGDFLVEFVDFLKKALTSGILGITHDDIMAQRKGANKVWSMAAG
jgi:hypothetical protein